MSRLKDQLINLGEDNKDLRRHIRPVLAELRKEANLKSVTQQGGRPRYKRDKEIAKELQDALKRAGLWRNLPWEYHTHSSFAYGLVGYGFVEEMGGEMFEVNLDFEKEDRIYSARVENWDNNRAYLSEESKDLQSLIRKLKKALKPVLREVQSNVTISAVKEASYLEHTGSIRDQLTRLSSQRKDLRPHIRPVLAELDKQANGAPNKVLQNVSGTSEFKAVVKGGEALGDIKEVYLKEAKKFAPQRAHDYMGKMFDRAFWPAFSNRLADLVQKRTFRFESGRALDSALKMGLDAADKEIYGTVHTDVYGFPPRGNKRDWSKLD